MSMILADMLVVAVLPTLLTLFWGCDAIWPAGYSVHEQYHVHFATFEDADEDLEMVPNNAISGLNTAETELRMLELDEQLDAASDGLDDDAWYPTDYEQGGDTHRKRGLNAGSLRVGRLVVDGKASLVPIDTEPDTNGKTDTDVETNADIKNDTDPESDGKQDADVKPDTNVTTNAEGKLNADNATDIEVDSEAAYDYAALRHDYDTEAEAMLAAAANSTTSTEDGEGRRIVNEGHSHDGRRSRWGWPKMHAGFVFLAVLGVYVLIAIPCYCARGWCCCCFFWVPLCRPRDIIREAKRYAAQNPPGVMVVQQTGGTGSGKVNSAEDDNDSKDTDSPDETQDVEGAKDVIGANSSKDLGVKDVISKKDLESVKDAQGAKDIKGITDVEGDEEGANDVKDDADMGKQARRRRLQPSEDGIVRYTPTRGEQEAYEALMEALRGL